MNYWKGSFVDMETRCNFCPCKYAFGKKKKQKCIMCLDTRYIPSDFGINLLLFLIKYTNVTIKKEWLENTIIDRRNESCPK